MKIINRALALAGLLAVGLLIAFLTARADAAPAPAAHAASSTGSCMIRGYAPEHGARGWRSHARIGLCRHPAYVLAKTCLQVFALVGNHAAWKTLWRSCRPLQNRVRHNWWVSGKAMRLPSGLLIRSVIWAIANGSSRVVVAWDQQLIVT